MEATLTRLLKDGDRIAGAFGYRREDGRFVLFGRKAVVLATGGWGRVYKVTSTPGKAPGTACAMAYEVGAELMDMEFVQFHPTGMVWPPGVRGILVTEAVRGEGGILLNTKDERFMLVYDPKKMSCAAATSWRAPSTRKCWPDGASSTVGPSSTSRSGAAEYIKKKLPSMYDQFLPSPTSTSPRNRWKWPPRCTTPWAGCGWARDERDERPGALCRRRGAAGSTGQPARRQLALATSSSSASAPGEHAAGTRTRLAQEPAVDDAQADAERRLLLAPLEPRQGENPYQIHEELQDVMGVHAGIARDGDQLEGGARGDPGAPGTRRDRCTSAARCLQPGLAHLPRRSSC